MVKSRVEEIEHEAAMLCDLHPAVIRSEVRPSQRQARTLALLGYAREGGRCLKQALTSSATVALGTVGRDVFIGVYPHWTGPGRQHQAAGAFLRC